MRFMIIGKATKETESGVMPSEETFAEMGRYNEELMKAGVLLDLAGLQPSAKGARIQFRGDKKTVVDGPFTETKEMIAGYQIIQVNSREEAIAWVMRAPNTAGSGEAEVEIRQLFELEELGDNQAVRDAIKRRDTAVASRK